MLRLVGGDECLRNIYRLARQQRSADALTDFESIRRGYLMLLDAKNPAMPVNFALDPFIDDPEAEDGLSAAFEVDVALNDMHQTSVVDVGFDAVERADRIRQAKAGLHAVQRRDPDFNLIFGLAVHSVFCRPAIGGQAHAGSSSGMIGSIWLAPTTATADADLREMFVHELTHVLIFIDELNHEQFDYDAIAQPENFALSAILLRERPLDKVVHSIVVAAELILARQHVLGEPEDPVVHPTSECLARSALEAANTLLERTHIHGFVSDRLLGFVERSRGVFASVAEPVGATR